MLCGAERNDALCDADDSGEKRSDTSSMLKNRPAFSLFFFLKGFKGRFQLEFFFPLMLLNVP